MSSTPADLVNLVYDNLKTWAEANSGHVAITAQPFDLVNMLAETPTGWQLIIHWQGDKPASESVRSGGVVDNDFRFVVHGDLGPTRTPRIALIKTTAARTPFLALLDAVYFRVMSYRFTGLAEPNNHFWYRGCDDAVPLPDGLALAAYNLRFMLRSIKSQPAVGDEIELGAQ